MNASTMVMTIAFLSLGFGPAPAVGRVLTLRSVLFLAEQAVETVTVFGKSGFIAPGGTMNVYQGGLIGFIWVGLVSRWAMARLGAALRPRGGL